MLDFSWYTTRCNLLMWATSVITGGSHLSQKFSVICTLYCACSCGDDAKFSIHCAALSLFTQYLETRKQDSYLLWYLLGLVISLKGSVFTGKLSCTWALVQSLWDHEKKSKSHQHDEVEKVRFQCLPVYRQKQRIILWRPTGLNNISSLSRNTPWIRTVHSLLLLMC